MAVARSVGTSYHDLMHSKDQRKVWNFTYRRRNNAGSGKDGIIIIVSLINDMTSTNDMCRLSASAVTSTKSHWGWSLIYWLPSDWHQRFWHIYLMHQLCCTVVPFVFPTCQVAYACRHSRSCVDVRYLQISLSVVENSEPDIKAIFSFCIFVTDYSYRDSPIELWIGCRIVWVGCGWISDTDFFHLWLWDVRLRKYGLDWTCRSERGLS